MKRSPLLAGMLALALVCVPAARAQQSGVDVWQTLLKEHYFPGIRIIEDPSVITLVTPYRAEDAAVTPVRIEARIPQTPQRYIETIYLLVDGNPEPLAAKLHCTPRIGRADVAFRIRIDRYTNVRAIAVLNTGEHHMAVSFVKAQGGCAAAPVTAYEQAMAQMGRMVLRAKAGDDAWLAAQLQVRHPNYTGMQMDYRIYAVRPAHFINTVDVRLDGERLMHAETGISVSEDPSYRFFVRPDAGAQLTAEVADSIGNRWQDTLVLTGDR